MGSALGDEAGEDFGAVVDEMMDAEHQGHGGGEPSGEGVDEPL
jgi:hypothetical protein